MRPRRKRGTFSSDFQKPADVKLLKKHTKGYVSVSRGFLKVKIGEKKYFVGLRKLTKVLRGEQPYTRVYSQKLFEESKKKATL